MTQGETAPLLPVASDAVPPLVRPWRYCCIIVATAVAAVATTVATAVAAVVRMDAETVASWSVEHLPVLLGAQWHERRSKVYSTYVALLGATIGFWTLCCTMYPMPCPLREADMLNICTTIITFMNAFFALNWCGHRLAVQQRLLATMLPRDAQKRIMVGLGWAILVTWCAMTVNQFILEQQLLTNMVKIRLISWMGNAGLTALNLVACILVMGWWTAFNVQVGQTWLQLAHLMKQSRGAIERLTQDLRQPDSDLHSPERLRQQVNEQLHLHMSITDCLRECHAALRFCLAVDIAFHALDMMVFTFVFFTSPGNAAEFQLSPSTYWLAIAYDALGILFKLLPPLWMGIQASGIEAASTDLHSAAAALQQPNAEVITICSNFMLHAQSVKSRMQLHIGGVPITSKVMSTLASGTIAAAIFLVTHSSWLVTERNGVAAACETNRTSGFPGI